jgi:hypothetical protein
MTEEEVNDRIHDFETKRNTRILQAVLGLVGVLLVVSFNFWYTTYVAEKNDQKWCDLFVGLDDNYQSIPPSKLTAEQKDFAAKVHVLRRELHCSLTTHPKQ